jgi:hypothetical protein
MISYDYPKLLCKICLGLVDADYADLEAESYPNESSRW